MLTAAFVCLLLLTHPSDTNVGVSFPKTQPILIQVMEILKHCWCGWFRSSSDLLHTLLPNECLRHLQPLGQKMEVRSKQNGGSRPGNPMLIILETFPTPACSSLIPANTSGDSTPRCCIRVCTWRAHSHTFCDHSCALILAATASFVLHAAALKRLSTSSGSNGCSVSQVQSTNPVPWYHRSHP